MLIGDAFLHQCAEFMPVYCIIQGSYNGCPRCLCKETIMSVTPSRRANGLILLTLAFGFVMAMLDVTAVNVALSDIALDLPSPSRAWSGWSTATP